MSLNLVDSTFVIAARNFNPPIVNQLWLVENMIVERDEFLPGCIFTDFVANVQSRDFELLVAPGQFQLRPRVLPELQQAILAERVGRFVEALPHTPYNAVGLNFVFHLIPEQADAWEVSRRLFFVSESPLHREFEVAEAAFGGYMSKPMYGGRMRVDIKPSKGTRPAGDEVKFFVLGFNFHNDIAGTTAVSTIREMLGRWTEARTLATSLADVVSQGDRS